MSSAIRFENRLEGANNFTAWKLWIMMILDENNVDSFVKDKSIELENEPKKSQWIENNKKAVKLIVDSIRNHTVPILAK